ncbi:glutamate--cysteine ligase catalytic subunit-like isoform X2 [Tachypleus tridentatus]|uniref:glutamate--cysteine ligase catalytic subunit-like isoform X2 n=1 Tax=Tachypleus tridentatus TaxID=6853 RepID=UPI003FD214E7
MGLLTEGTLLSWQETKQWADYVKRHGVQQFIKLFNKQRDRVNDVFIWGDETEYAIIKFEHDKKMARVSLRSEEVLDHMNMLENLGKLSSLWHPELGAYMVEAMPSKPYSGLIHELNMVETNMRTRLGCDDFMDPATNSLHENNTNSLVFLDETIIHKHPKFGAITRNIRNRRRKKVIINVPIYKDQKTLTPHENLQDEKSERVVKNHIYMDNTIFGTGCCSLQVTLQASNIQEAKILHDHLAVLSPIMMALSASSPAYRGYLSDRDCRWSVIVNSLDDRTDEERGIKPRYSSVNSYLSSEGEILNDVEVVFDRRVYKELRDAGVDHLLSQHVAHLFIREPLFLFSENIHPKSEDDIFHYENIHSTNWQTVRLKVPSEGSSGWRVEFRPMEVQFTDFENAAYAVFIVLLTRVILSLNMDLLIPISKVDENYEEAEKRDAVRSGTFWFKTNIKKSKKAKDKTCCSDEWSYAKMTMNEIINGKDNLFPGLIPLIRRFLRRAAVEVDTLRTLQKYLELLQHRASGKLLTTAQWIREYILDHPDYRQDSVVTERINYDLLCTADRIQRGELKSPRLLGSF